MRQWELSMVEFTCSNCGQRVQGDECPHCRAATAIATPEHAGQAKVTSSAGAIREGEPPAQYEALPSRSDESAASILKEHHPSFGSFALFYLLLGVLWGISSITVLAYRWLVGR
jgi:hypothetical protein